MRVYMIIIAKVIFFSASLFNLYIKTQLQAFDIHLTSHEAGFDTRSFYRDAFLIPSVSPILRAPQAQSDELSPTKQVLSCGKTINSLTHNQRKR